MTKIEQDLINIANEGQTDKKIFKGEAFTRAFAGRAKNVAELRNPELIAEIKWLNRLKSAIKLFHNEIVIANRILGIKNDNEYDVRVFEKVVKEKFFMQLRGKNLKKDTLIETDFKTMVEMVELGVRRFGR